jgi:signal transduction histidine kinase
MQSEQPQKSECRKAASGKPPRVLGELRRKVLGWMLLVSLVPMAVIAISGYQYSVQAIVEKTRDHLLSQMSSRQSLVETWVSQHLSELDVLASSPSVARCCAHFKMLSEEDIDAEATAMLRAIVRRVDAYDELCVCGEDGSAVARVQQEGVPTEPETENVAKGVSVISILPPERAADGHVTVKVVLPLTRGDTRVGAIVATLNLTKGLDPLLQNRAGMGQTGKVYVTTKDGALLTEPVAGETPAALFAHVSKEHLELAQAHEPKVAELTDYAGHRVWGSAARIARTDWLLVVEQDQVEATIWVRKLLHRAVLTGLIAVVVIILITLWISERLGRPLRDLAQVARSIRGGHVEARLGPMRGAEADEVRRTFNEMLDDLKEKQRQLVLSATLASVGELSSSVVHEMRNPLSSIKMNLQALRRRVKGDPDYEELAEIAAGQAQRVETMLDDLLQFGRPVELHPEPTSFRELTEPSLAILADKAKEKNLTIELNDALGDTRLSVDREHMCRVMTNLLANAIQAVAPGQSIAVAGALLNGAGPRRVQLEVSDTGPGLSPEALERAFTPFFTSKPEGTGLGLANVKKIIELHGGSVSAHNRPEGGASITLVLPIEE